MPSIVEVYTVFYESQSPIGLTLTHADGRAFRVVGFVADARLVVLDRPSRGEIAMMLVVAAAATLVPSWLVSRADPVRSLTPE